MAGIDKITAEILESGRQRAAELTDAANADAAKILAAAKAEIRENGAKNQERIREDDVKAGQRAKSQAGLARRQTLLAAKQGIVDEIIEKAYQKLASQSDEAYFAMIEKLLIKNIRKGSGEILFGKRDLARLPLGFPIKLGIIALAAGGELQIASKPAKIDNGFILRYGGIEENCSLKALFAAKQNELSDAVLAALGNQ
ncbi:MAG: V-type ATP synthase subunit E [Lachnospiraceae bacterium]